MGGGVVLGGALIAPQSVQAGPGNLNPPAISRAQANLLKHAEAYPKNPCNPCAAKKNPCNPCAAKKNPCNPCAAKNPCAAGNPCNPCNPCAAKKNPCNPCGANPCAGADIDPKLVVRPKGTMMYKGDMAALVREGEKLFKDTSLSTNGMSCQTCHGGLELFNNTFMKAYPHMVEMPMNSSGVNSVSLDEMVQFCMLAPMESKPFPWESRELAAVTAYTATLQKAFMAKGANPCNPCNPCAARNPCNPCAAKNPCNPCAAKNPCAAN
ncbi:MAG: cytochrome C peroxidase [Rhodospirillales bacterium]|nr:cytochrome C peroxidase [Rhodospirillales bacterium]